MLFAMAIGALCLALAACAVAYLQTRRLTESQQDREKLERSSRVIEEERHVLELIAKGCSLKEVLDALTAAIERMAPDCYCTVLLLDDDKNQLFEGSGGGLPPAGGASIGALGASGVQINAAPAAPPAIVKPAVPPPTKPTS